MSFSFGAPKTEAPAPSFSFGNAGGDAKTPAKAFGAQTQPNMSIGFGASFAPAKPASSFTLGASPAPSFNLAAGSKPPSFNLASTPAPAAAAPASGFSLGATAPSFSLGGTPNSQAATGFQAATTPASGFQAAAAPASTPAPTFNLAPSTASTGFSLGGTPAATPASIGFNLGAAKTTASTGFSLTASTPATAATAPTISFGAAATASTAATAPAAVAPTLGLSSKPGISFGTPTAITTTAGFSLATTTTATTTSLPSSLTTASVVPATGTLTFAQLEDAINKWTIDLEEQGKLFGNQAKQLNAWDRLLISNGEKVLSLNNSIERVKQQQQNLDQELDFVLAQQKELEDLITPLEKELNEQPVTDVDRNHTYQLAETMDTQMKQMSEDLKEIIEQLNEANKTQEMSNPITQIGKILNAHMNSLQWIDRNTTKISTHLDQITKMHDINRRSHEKSFQRTYD